VKIALEETAHEELKADHKFVKFLIENLKTGRFSVGDKRYTGFVKLLFSSADGQSQGREID